jgi:hypothetical protein
VVGWFAPILSTYREQAMQQFTKEQALAIMGFTGVATCRFDIFHEDVERRLGRPIWTHEFASPQISEEVKAAYRADFIGMCLP